MESKIINFIKKRVELVSYIFLAIIVYISIWIRTRNLPGLRDITTGGWTLGPDLDPFLFLRYAKHIVENGSLFAIDTMRYVPLGFDTSLEYPLLHHSIAWFHNFINIFVNWSVERSAVYFPVFMFALTVISFFLMAREAFSKITPGKDSNYIALIASFFLAVIPSFIPRSIAGIPEKESVAFFFLFTSFYFFIRSWDKKNNMENYIFSSLGGVFAGLMALTWGGYGYIPIILSLTVLVLFLFGEINLERKISFYLFIFFSFIIPLIFFPRFSIYEAVGSIEWVIPIFLCFAFFIDSILHRKFPKYIPGKLKNYPKLTSLIYTFLVTIFIGFITNGFNFLLRTFNKFYGIINPNVSRLIQTVAENRQPFFIEWVSNFGPIFLKFNILFIFSFISSTILFHSIFKRVISRKKDLFVATLLWTIFFSTISFTRYNSSSIFNGSNFISTIFYIGGLVLFIGGLTYISNKKIVDEKITAENNLFIGPVFTLIFLAVALQSARSFIRLVLVLVPVISLLIGYLSVISLRKLFSNINERKIFTLNSLLCGFTILLIIFAAYSHYSSAVNLSRNYTPSVYNQQWQKAMFWVRENTPQNAVFGHWWDYGYWLQSIGNRATALDGGNLLGYWNHLMGRYALTGTDSEKTMEFLYAHNITHFLIDSTDIGKYSAFSTIGSNKDYDRRSWIPTFIKDDSQTVERKNQTVFVYPGGTTTDEDIKYLLNGTEIFLPAGKTYVAAIVVNVAKDGSISEVYGVYYLQEKTYQIPLRYYWDKKNDKLVDVGAGIDHGVLLYPKVAQQNAQGGVSIDQRGAAIYLSQRVVSTNLARFYLYGEENENFKLTHLEPDYVVEILKTQGAINTDFIFFNEFRGPIKIWEINYPSSIKFNPDFIKTEYPEELLYQ